MLTEVIEALETVTELKCYPFYAEKLEECIIYEWTPQSDDGSKAQGRLTVRIRTATMSYAEVITSFVKDALLSFADNTRYGAYIKHNGGGMLKNADTGYIDTILYFDFIYRSGGF